MKEQKTENALRKIQATEFYSDLCNTQIALFAINHAYFKRKVTLICGDAGAGKTTALRYYAEHNSNVILVTANSCTSSSTAILSMICDKLGKKVPSRRAAIMKLLVSELKGTDILLIIDEADHLKLNALQAIRNLNDEADIGIVLSGNDKIYNQMLLSRRGYEFDQIRTRIAVRQRVSNNYTVEEISAIFPNVGNECLSFLLDLAQKESLRTAKDIFNTAVDYALVKNEPFSLKLLKTTKQQLLGTVL